MLPKDQRRIIRYYKFDRRLNTAAEFRACFRHTVNNPMPFKIRHEIKKYHSLSIVKVNNRLVQKFIKQYNPSEFLSVNRSMKEFSVIQYHFGYVLLGITFIKRHQEIKHITFPDRISVNGKEVKQLSFKFPRVALKMHSYFNLPQLPKKHIAHFFHTFKNQLLTTGYDLVLIDAPVGSELDLIMRGVPAFLFWKQIPDRRLYFYLDGKQTNHQTLRRLTKQWHYKGFFDKFGARLEYHKESIMCNRYVTSISDETILPMSKLKRNESIYVPEIQDPDKFDPELTALLPKKVLALNTSPEKLKKYGW